MQSTDNSECNFRRKQIILKYYNITNTNIYKEKVYLVYFWKC